MYFTLNVFEDPRRLPVLFESFDKLISGENWKKILSILKWKR
ncbi:MAG: hypothetical protein CM15mV42_1820 [uncultured marine virus]|nr:MAG: hypothetical protein CM15mV42_1820 [uncultured marine virus]